MLLRQEVSFPMLSLDRSILLRGGGDLATGVAVILLRAGHPVVVAELPEPRVVRRAVALAEAVYEGRVTVEGVAGVRCDGGAAALAALGRPDEVPVVVDPELASFCAFRFLAVVDATMRKRPPDARPACGRFWVGLGPGFTAGRDVDAVIETQRGPLLGRAILDGAAEADTGVPGEVGGESLRRLLRAPADGIWRTEHVPGDLVREGDVVAAVETPGGALVEVRSALDGKLRGLLRPGLRVARGLKVGDVDPRGAAVDHRRISDKALAVGRGVLEALRALEAR
jgi:xanthine dehydrogenase accessory factor